MIGRARIIGYGVLAGTGRGVDSFWSAMRAARPALSAHDLGDSRLDPAQYVAVPEAREPNGDLATSWLELACEDALIQAAETLGAMKTPRMALLAGSSLGGMTLFERQHRAWWDPTQAAGPAMPAGEAPLWRALYDGPTNATRAALGGVAWAVTLNTACSSAANALGLARRWLLLRRIDVAVVAGYDVISPFVYAGFQAVGAMDPQPSTPFGRERRGLNLGDAAIALVLARPEDAAPTSEPVDVVGYASSCDAHHLTRPDLGGKGLARAIRAALADGGFAPEDVGFVSAHGTGTPYNDTMEAAAFAAVFRDLRPGLHCAKPVTGHTLGAAGAVDAVLVCLALQHGLVPATYLRGLPDPALPFQPTHAEQSLARDTLALSTSSGFGGSNAALLFRRGDA